MNSQDTSLATRKDARRAPSFTDQLIEPLSRLRSEVDRLFDDIPARFPGFAFGRASTMAVPAVEMTETDKAYKLSVELPGLEAEDVEVTFEDGILRIAGEKKEEREENERGFRLSERSYGRFERLIELPAAADGDQVKASFKNGLLTISVLKDTAPEKQARRISVEKA